MMGFARTDGALRRRYRQKIAQLQEEYSVDVAVLRGRPGANRTVLDAVHFRYRGIAFEAFVYQQHLPKLSTVCYQCFSSLSWFLPIACYACSAPHLGTVIENRLSLELYEYNYSSLLQLYENEDTLDAILAASNVLHFSFAVLALVEKDG